MTQLKGMLLKMDIRSK